MRNKNKVVIIYAICIIMLLIACTPSKIQKRIEETEKENTENMDQDDKKKETDEHSLSSEQLEILDNIKGNTANEALLLNELDQREEIHLEKPVKRESYKDPSELAQLLSYLFYSYHTKEIDAAEFYKEASPYFHENFKSLLPDDKKNQIETFSVLQEKFDNLLKSPIIDNAITNTEINIRKNEATFYRQYKLENGEKIYFLTTLELKDDLWFLSDDRPTPPYEIIPGITNELENN